MVAARILVIGGRGFYGARVVAELGEHETWVGTRGVGSEAARTATVDLQRPETFAVFALEMGADAPTIERLLERPTAGARGAAVLGVGVFPGLSTALAKAVAERGADCGRLEVLAWVAWALRSVERPVAWVLEQQLIALRAWLLRGRESSVELVAVADRGTPTEPAGWLRFEYGQQSTRLDRRGSPVEVRWG